MACANKAIHVDARPRTRAIALSACVACLLAVGFMLPPTSSAASGVAKAPAVSGSVPSGSSTSGSIPSSPGSTSPAPPSSVATATLEQCATSTDSETRGATFIGQMSSVAGTRRMAMQITVQEQGPGDSGFHTLLAAPSGWKRSEAGVKIYKYVRQVTDLPAPGAFRAVVQFRWIGEKGHIVKRAVRHTAVCVQPDERAKLVVAGVLSAPRPAGSGGLAGYEVVIRNEGRSDAGPFQVVLGVNGGAQAPLTVPSLDAGARTVLDAQGPVCAAGGDVEITLDPTHQIPEAAGGGQSDTLTCPLSEAAQR